MSGAGLGHVAAVAVAVGLLGCGALGPHTESAGGTAAHPVRHPRLEVRKLSDRPAITRVDRQGDPAPAMAAALAHDLGPRASVALAALLEARLAAAGIAGVVARPHALGVQISATVQSEQAARDFVAKTSVALERPVQAGEPGLETAKQRVAALRAVTTRASAAAREADRCVGDLLDDGAPLGALDAATLESFRAQVFRAENVAFAVIGARAVLDAATAAIEALEPWPAGAGAVDPWPEADAVGVEPSPASRELSVAVRVADPAVALAAARALGRGRAALAARLDALEPAWRVRRIVGTTRPRGACLRIDVSAPAEGPAPSPAAVARAALVLESELLRHGDGAKDGGFALEDSVLRPTDPREAASVAAWCALSGRHAGGATRHFVSYRGALDAGGDERAVARILTELRHARLRPSLESRSRIEPGQGELWLLLASPCGTTTEGADDAGATALALSTMARSAGDVTIEPWLTPDGAGLVAHGPKARGDESPTDHAQRVADALGRALAASRVTGPSLSAERTELMSELGPGPRKLFWLTVDALSPAHPSWLEPRGTFAALAAMSGHVAEARRRDLLRGPLRLAVLANADAGQVGVAREQLETWLLPYHDGAARCARGAPSAPRRGELLVDVRDGPERAFVAVALPHSAMGIPREAHEAALLLDDALESAVGTTGMASARAMLMGGRRASAIVVELSAFEGESAAAVAQTRALLQRMAHGAVSAAASEAARREVAQRIAASEFDPRRRLIDTWGAPPAPPSSHASLLRFLATAFRPEAHLVVRPKPGD